GKLERLARIEARSAMRMIAIAERRFGDRLRAADAFGDVLAGHLEMDAARIAAFGRMDGEEAFDLAQDLIDQPRLVAGGRGDGVAMHGIAAPENLAPGLLHRADQGRQLLR